MDTEIEKALALCDEIAGPDEEQDSLPTPRSSTEVVGILRGEVERLRGERNKAVADAIDLRGELAHLRNKADYHYYKAIRTDREHHCVWRQRFEAMRDALLREDT